VSEVFIGRESFGTVRDFFGGGMAVEFEVFIFGLNLKQKEAFLTFNLICH